MAVVQISRIQIRRGKAQSGTGFPQLASGEMGWAVDTQEIYVGNGSVAEGAPAVGNTKILTVNDLSVQGNILNLVQHIYKGNDPTITTGVSANSPVSRSLQDNLDDLVSTVDFGTVGDSATDDTAALQRAIDQLFLNGTNKASESNAASTSTRIVLKMLPGIYKITSTLYIPSYASLIGAGADKTIINYTGTGPAIVFINDSSTIGNPSSIGTTLYSTQPRHIELRGLTIHTTSDDQSCLQLDAVRDSIFDELIIQGDWGNVPHTTSKGIVLNAVASGVHGTGVSTEGNIFSNITVTGFTSAVWAKQDIINNTFRDCFITDVKQGFVFGEGANGSTPGEQYGPRETQIINCKFEDVKWHAVYIERGTKNTTRDNRLINVGNHGAGPASPQTPQIYFNTPGNTSQNDQSDRAEFLAGINTNVPYVPEVSGHATYTSYATRSISLGQITSPTLAFRLPVSTDQYGDPINSVTYNIEYVYKSVYNVSRRGTMTLVADLDASTALSVRAPVTQLTDEYDFTGSSGPDSTKLDFKIVLLAQDGTPYDGSNGTSPYSIGVYYTNTWVGDSGTLTYKYTAVF